VIEGLGFEDTALIPLNLSLSVDLFSIRCFYFGGFSIYFGNGFMNPSCP
jgi:hypothetical protein